MWITYVHPALRRCRSTNNRGVMDTLSKSCFKCGKTYPLDQFYRNQHMADGRTNVCHTCKVDRKKFLENQPAVIGSLLAGWGKT